MLNVSDLMAIKDALEETYTDGINAIVSVDLDEDDNLFGTFRDGKKLYDFILNPDASSPGDQVSYTLQNPDVINKNDADIDWKWEMKNDAYVFIFPEYWRMDKAKNCTKGTACGGSCIPATKTCRAKEGLSEGSKTKLKGVKEKISKSAKVGDLTRKEMQDAILKEFGAKSLKEVASKASLRDSSNPKDLNGKDLQKTSTLAQVYRNRIGVIPNDPVNQKGERGVFNGINALNYFRPWTVFNLDPKTASKDDIDQAFNKISKGLDKKDPQLYDRLKTMRDSISTSSSASSKGKSKRK